MLFVGLALTPVISGDKEVKIVRNSRYSDYSLSDLEKRIEVFKHFIVRVDNRDCDC